MLNENFTSTDVIGLYWVNYDKETLDKNQKLIFIITSLYLIPITNYYGSRTTEFTKITVEHKNIHIYVEQGWSNHRS